MPNTRPCAHCGTVYDYGRGNAESVIQTHERSCVQNPERRLTQEEIEATWPARLAAGERAIPLMELSSYGETRLRLHYILVALDQADGHFTSSSGLATKLLVAKLPFVAKNMPELLGRLEAAGWIARTKNAKRTYNIGRTQVYGRADWPKEALDATGAAVAETYVGGQAAAPVVHEPPVPAETLPAPPPLDQAVASEPVGQGRSPRWPSEPEYSDDDRQDFGERPGRAIARLERELPELVTGAVRRELDGIVAGLLGALGYHRHGVSPEEIEALQMENATMVADIARLKTTIESQAERERTAAAMIDYLTDEAQAPLPGTNEGTQASRDGLTLRQLPDAFKTTGALAIDQGWSVFRTRGKAGHLMWRSPDGKVAYSATTPSNDFIANQILLRKLRRLGFTDSKGNTGAQADVDRWAHQAAEVRDG